VDEHLERLGERVPRVEALIAVRLVELLLYPRNLVLIRRRHSAVLPAGKGEARTDAARS
jgi:hypothetical protein